MLPDLAVHEPVGDELENLDLAGGRFLLQLPQGRRGRERDHRSGRLRAPTRRSRLEPAAVVPVPVEDLPPLCGVHGFGIGFLGDAL